MDWPAGQTGTVSLGGNDPTSLATGPIDANGHFTITLPDQQTVDLKLPNVSGLFLPVSNLRSPEDACVGQGTAAPEDAHYNNFGLTASIEGGEPIFLKLRSDTRVPYQVGQGKVRSTASTKPRRYTAPSAARRAIRC